MIAADEDAHLDSRGVNLENSIREGQSSQNPNVVQLTTTSQLPMAAEPCRTIPIANKVVQPASHPLPTPGGDGSCQSTPLLMVFLALPSPKGFSEQPSRLNEMNTTNRQRWDTERYNGRFGGSAALVGYSRSHQVDGPTFFSLPLPCPLQAGTRHIVSQN